jgi:hypothetical protein
MFIAWHSCPGCKLLIPANQSGGQRTNCPRCGVSLTGQDDSAAEPVWYYARNNRKIGPLSLAQLRGLSVINELSPHDMIWREGMEKWHRAIVVNGLFTGQEVTSISPAPPSPSPRNPADLASAGTLQVALGRATKVPQPSTQSKTFPRNRFWVLLAGVTGIGAVLLVAVVLIVADFLSSMKDQPENQQAVAAKAVEPAPPTQPDAGKEGQPVVAEPPNPAPRSQADPVKTPPPVTAKVPEPAPNRQPDRPKTTQPDGKDNSAGNPPPIPAGFSEKEWARICDKAIFLGLARNPAGVDKWAPALQAMKSVFVEAGIKEPSANQLFNGIRAMTRGGDGFALFSPEETTLSLRKTILVSKYTKMPIATREQLEKLEYSSDP